MLRKVAANSSTRSVVPRRSMMTEYSFSDSNYLLLGKSSDFGLAGPYKKRSVALASDRQSSNSFNE